MASPNMNLTVPVVLTTPGPDYATQVNSDLSIIDAHDHSPGSGVQISPTGMNINSDLAFNNNNLTNVRSTRYSQQSATFTALTDVRNTYVVGVDLYFNDGNGVPVRITENGAVAGTPGSISNLVSPASASYSGITDTFIWQSNANTPANMDAASYVFRNLVANSKGLTLSPPAAMAADYSIVLPTLPIQKNMLTMDTSGNMAADSNVDNSTIQWTNILGTYTLAVKPLGITAAEIANGTITRNKLASDAVLTTTTVTSSGTWTAPAGTTTVIFTAVGAGGGGGGGGEANNGGVSFGGGGGGGGGAGQVSTATYSTVGGEVFTIVVGAGGSGGPGDTTSSGGGNGTIGGLTSVSAPSRGNLIAYGGAAGVGGKFASGGGTSGYGGNGSAFLNFSTAAQASATGGIFNGAGPSVASNDNSGGGGGSGGRSGLAAAQAGASSGSVSGGGTGVNNSGGGGGAGASGLYGQGGVGGAGCVDSVSGAAGGAGGSFIGAGGGGGGGGGAGAVFGAPGGPGAPGIVLISYI